MMRVKLAVTTMLATLTACGGTDANHVAADGSVTDGTTAITLIDSVAVVETDSVFVGRPNAITLDAAGRVYISDAAAKRVLRVERDGSGLTPITRVGAGPGEVQRPSSLAMVGDSVLAVYDGGQRRVVLFNRESMAARGSIATGGFATSIRSWRKGLVVGALMVDSLTAFALLANNTAVPQRGGSVPRIYLENPPIAQAFGTVEVARDDSTVVGVFEGSGTAYRWHLRSKQIDSAVLTASTRRGARPEVLLELMRNPSKAPTLMFTWSFPMLVGMLSQDRSAVVTYDPTLSGSNFTGPAHVQVVDWRTRLSCREVLLPVSAEIPGRYAMRGDTLTALVQHADSGGDGTGASTWIVRWVIGGARC
ncbi:hypothetical protein [Gemmatimonas sp.]|uniref:hypothetical protein n=1 Tax=Gemmatimonas sp. TaxID=1962908 RepID=UPI00356B3E2C